MTLPHAIDLIYPDLTDPFNPTADTADTAPPTEALLTLFEDGIARPADPLNLIHRIQRDALHAAYSDYD